MGVSSIRGSERERDRDALRAPAATPTVGELAWIAALPCLLVTAAAVLVLGPLIGHALLEPGAERLWPQGSAVFVYGYPEPVKHGRFLVALLGPALLAAVVLAGARRPLPQLRREAIRGLVTASQLLLVAGVLAATLAQRHVVYDGLPTAWRIFSLPTLALALAAVVALALAPRSARLARPLARLRSDARRVRIACLALAVVLTALWLLPAVVTDRAIAHAPFPDLPPWAMGDTYAILDGRTPLVDFHPIYGYLWAYVAAVPMRLLGATFTVFTVTMASISAVALVAVYGVLRRVVGRAPLALALYLPFLATSLFAVGTEAPPWRVTNSQIYSVWPMRYAGPLLLASLTARHLDGARPRRPWALFLVGGLVALNNLELGLGALAGTLVALACSPASWSPRAARRLALHAAAGVLGAAALLALLTLLRAGTLPHLGLLLEFPRLFGVLGLAELPMALVGFQLVIYATLAAALALAAVRVARREPDVLLTGMLAWSGVFGLAAGSYFIGRSDALKLAALLPTWSLALMLLLVVALRSLAAREWRRPSPAELLVLFGFGLATCSLAQLSPPWHELERLRASGAPLIYAQPEAHRLVDRTTRPGEHVAILIPMGHRIAYDLHVVDVSPYAFLDEIATRAQMRTLLDAMRREHAHKLYVLTQHLAPEHRRVLARAGFSERAQLVQYSYWADAAVARQGAGG
jgi:hypothetical protein